MPSTSFVFQFSMHELFIFCFYVQSFVFGTLYLLPWHSHSNSKIPDPVSCCTS
uniref:Uncharacterized protein n=1 Tax=Rhizophora mucronata TaxID=61149 RepID=A0A2P2QK95_RHIMU